MLFNPGWYSMLPNTVKPLTNEQIRAVEAFRKSINGNNQTTFLGIMISPWTVAKIQRHHLAEFKKSAKPGVTERELWKTVLLNRLATKALWAGEHNTDPNAKPLTKEQVMSRAEKIEETVAGFKTFDDVIKYILEMDKLENRFYDPSGLSAELNRILEDNQSREDSVTITFKTSVVFEKQVDEGNQLGDGDFVTRRDETGEYITLSDDAIERMIRETEEGR